MRTYINIFGRGVLCKKYSTALYFLLIIFFAVNSNVFPQNDLQFYLNAAFRNNPKLKENLDLIKLSELDKSLVESELLYPQISATANYLFAPHFNNNGKLVSTNPDPNAIGYDIGITNGGLYSALINIEKKIFNGGTIDVFKNQSDLKIKSSSNESEVLKHSIQKDVTEQYLNTYKSQQLYILTKSIADTLKRELKIYEQLVYKGLTKQSDYLLLKIETDNQLIDAEQNLSEMRKNYSELNTFCGLQTAELKELSLPSINKEGEKLESNFVKQFSIDSSLVLNQQQSFETKYLPQVSIFFNTGLNAVELENIQRRFGLSAGINFSLPLYDGSQKSITQQQSQISLNTIASYKENQKIFLANNLKVAKEQMEFYKKNLTNVKDQVKNYEQLLRLAKAELMNGQRTMMDYVTVIKNYIELKKNEVSAEVSYQQSINNYNYWNW